MPIKRMFVLTHTDEGHFGDKVVFKSCKVKASCLTNRMERELHNH